MDTKFVIAVASEKCSGKTTTINYVWDLLPCYSSSEKVNLNEKLRHEVWGYIKPSEESKMIDRNYKVGVASRGDTPGEIIESVEPLMKKYNCDIIVCACHNPKDDGTFATIEKLSRENGYTLITYSQFCNYFADREALKNKFNSNQSPVITAGNVNLSRFSATNIVGLIELLAN